MTHKNPGVNSQVTMIWPQGFEKIIASPSCIREAS